MSELSQQPRLRQGTKCSSQRLRPNNFYFGEDISHPTIPQLISMLLPHLPPLTSQRCDLPGDRDLHTDCSAVKLSYFSICSGGSITLHFDSVALLTTSSSCSSAPFTIFPSNSTLPSSHLVARRVAGSTCWREGALRRIASHCVAWVASEVRSRVIYAHI